MKAIGVAAASFALGTGAIFTMLAFSATGAPQALDAGAQPLSNEVRLDAATTGIRWAGYSTSTYNGKVSSIVSRVGLRAANDICNNLYPGSYWAGADDIIHLGTQYPWTQNAWLQDYYYDQNKDCGHWSDGSAAKNGTYVSTVSIFAFGTACNNSFYLACVYRP